MDEACLELGLGLISEHARKRDNLQKNNKCGGVVLDLSISSHDPMANSSSSLKTTSVGGDERLGMKKALSNRRKEEDDWDNVCNRKKLSLTKDQSVLLEDTFKKHSTLITAQKHALAEQLNLKPRQVEVWFQNRRARTKLKQTEINCEFLRKNYERLSEENRRLKKELLELQRSSAGRQPFVYSRINPTEAKCDSCEKGGRG